MVWEYWSFFFFNLGFKLCEFDHRIYILHVQGDTLIVVVYVDDLVITSNNPNLILGLKGQLSNFFEMTNLGILHFFLGLQVFPLSDRLFISQSKYVLVLLKCFKMDDCNACTTPFHSGVKSGEYCESPKFDTTLYHWLVSSLIYLTQSWSKLSFMVSMVPHFM